MTWKVDRDQLIERVGILGLIPALPSAQSSEKIMIEPIKDGARFQLASQIAGYVDIKGEGKWPFKNVVFIDRRLFFPFVNVAKDIHSKSGFTFSSEGKELHVKNGTRKVTMVCSTPVKGYFGMGRKGQEIKIDPELLTMLSSATACAEKVQMDPTIGCVYARRNGKGLLLYATSTHNYYKAQVKTELKLKENFPFPILAIDILSDPRLKKIQISGREIVFDFGVGKLWQEVSRKARRKFPYKMFDENLDEMKKKSKIAFTVDSKSFAIVLNRLATYMSSVRRQDWVVKLIGRKSDKAEIEMSVAIANTVFKEKLSIRKSPTFNFEVEWPLENVLDAFSKIAVKHADLTVAFNRVNQTYVSMKNVEMLVPRRGK